MFTCTVMPRLCLYDSISKGCLQYLYCICMLIAKSMDPDQTPRFPASDLGQHCLRTWAYMDLSYNGDDDNCLVQITILLSFLNM